MRLTSTWHCFLAMQWNVASRLLLQKPGESKMPLLIIMQLLFVIWRSHLTSYDVSKTDLNDSFGELLFQVTITAFDRRIIHLKLYSEDDVNRNYERKIIKMSFSLVSKERVYSIFDELTDPLLKCTCCCCNLHPFSISWHPSWRLWALAISSTNLNFASYEIVLTWRFSLSYMENRDCLSNKLEKKTSLVYKYFLQNA